MGSRSRVLWLTREGLPRVPRELALDVLDLARCGDTWMDRYQWARVLHPRASESTAARYWLRWRSRMTRWGLPHWVGVRVGEEGRPLRVVSLPVDCEQVASEILDRAHLCRP